MSVLELKSKEITVKIASELFEVPASFTAALKKLWYFEKVLFPAIHIVIVARFTALGLNCGFCIWAEIINLILLLQILTIIDYFYMLQRIKIRENEERTWHLPSVFKRLCYYFKTTKRMNQLINFTIFLSKSKSTY